MIIALFIGFFMVGLILFVIGFKYWNPNKGRASKFLFKYFCIRRIVTISGYPIKKSLMKFKNGI